MSLARLANQQLTHLAHTTGAKDAHGNPAEMWVDTGTPVYGWLEQTDGTEVTTRRNTQMSDWLLVLRDATVVPSGRDRVADPSGRTFEVVGPPAIVRNRRGNHHVEARLVHIEG